VKSLLLFFVLGCLSAQAGSVEDAESDFKTANARLVTLSEQVSSAIFEITESSRQKQLFEESQRAWNQYRDAQAGYDAFAASSGRATFRTEYLRSSTRLTSERIKYLQILLEPTRYSQALKRHAPQSRLLLPGASTLPL
jgi:uncharacterized protein YecT (DUF1311 family)